VSSAMARVHAENRIRNRLQEAGGGAEGIRTLTSAVRGRGYGFEFGAYRERPFDQFPRDGGHGETPAGKE